VENLWRFECFEVAHSIHVTVINNNSEPHQYFNLIWFRTNLIAVTGQPLEQAFRDFLEEKRAI